MPKEKPPKFFLEIKKNFADHPDFKVYNPTHNFLRIALIKYPKCLIILRRKKREQILSIEINIEEQFYLYTVLWKEKQIIDKVFDQETRIETIDKKKSTSYVVVLPSYDSTFDELHGLIQRLYAVVVLVIRPRIKRIDKNFKIKANRFLTK